MIYSKDRNLYPMKRVDFDPNGERNCQNRGISGYERISWDEALDIVTAEIKRMNRDYGPGAILAARSSHHTWGNVGYYISAYQKFINIIGATTTMLNPDSWEGWYWGAMHHFGHSMRCGAPENYGTAEDCLEHCEMIVFWSSDPEATNGIYGGFEGIGNIDADPLFASPSAGYGTEFDGLTASWWTTSNSPCIDAGNPDAIYNDLDGTINDMGAYGGPDALQIPVNAEDNYQLETNNYQLSNFPNPFTAETTISFSLNTESAESAELEIYNIKGQKVETFSNLQIANSPDQQVTWDANNYSSGIYFYKLIVDNKEVGCNKMLLLK